LQSWEDVFSLAFWLRYPLLKIALTVKEKLGDGANPITNLQKFSSAFCMEWITLAMKDK